MTNRFEERVNAPAMAKIHSLQLPMIAAGALVVTASPDLRGTVVAGAHGGDLSYADPDGLIRGAPIPQSAAPAAGNVRDRPRAKDLIAELDSINTQIHKIMFQVERAVARLATSG